MTMNYDSKSLLDIKNLKGDTFDYFLFSEIGANGITGQGFANDLEFISTYNEVKKINIRINSAGGSIIDGLAMLTAIKLLNERGIVINTYIDGVGASMAGVVAMAGKKRYMNDYSLLMIHDPHMGSAVLDEKDQNALDALKNTLVSILSNNSSVDESLISNLMTKETWLSASEALTMGLVDEIIVTKRFKDVATNVMEMANNFNNKTKIKMDKIAQLLNCEASEESILGAITKVKNELETATKTTKTVEELELENEALKLENETLKAEQATTFVEEQIEEGKLDAEKKDELVAQAKVDFTAFKNLISAIKVTAKPTSVIDLINKQSTPVDGTFNGKTFRELEKTEPKTLENLYKNDFATYNKLFKAQYGTDFKK